MTFENVQAGLRTDYLFRLANHNGALVVGTGDSVRAGARLVHLRGRRSDVALQPQRIGAEDADPTPDPVCRRIAATSDARPRRSSTISSPPKSRRSWCRPATTARSNRPRALSAPMRCRISRCSTSRASASRRRRSPIWRGMPGTTRRRGAWPENTPGSARRAFDLADIKRWMRVFLTALFRAEPVQALGAAERTENLVGRLAVAARRLARAVRFERRCVAAGARRGGARRSVKNAEGGVGSSFEASLHETPQDEVSFLCNQRHILIC